MTPCFGWGDLTTEDQRLWKPLKCDAMLGFDCGAWSLDAVHLRSTLASLANVPPQVQQHVEDWLGKNGHLYGLAEGSAKLEDSVQMGNVQQGGEGGEGTLGAGEIVGGKDLPDSPSKDGLAAEFGEDGENKDLIDYDDASYGSGDDWLYN